MSAIAAGSLVLVAATCLPVRAQVHEVVIEVPIFEPASYNASLMQAESLVGGVIRQQFVQDASLSSVQVVVVGTRHGETIPMMTTTVSRSQWQQQPQVAQWTTYNSTAQILFARFEDDEGGNQTVAVAPAASVRSYSSVDPVYGVEQAFEQGRLTRQEYQALVDALD